MHSSIYIFLQTSLQTFPGWTWVASALRQKSFHRLRNIGWFWWWEKSWPSKAVTWLWFKPMESGNGWTWIDSTIIWSIMCIADVRRWRRLRRNMRDQIPFGGLQRFRSTSSPQTPHSSFEGYCSSYTFIGRVASSATRHAAFKALTPHYL